MQLGPIPTKSSTSTCKSEEMFLDGEENNKEKESWRT